MKKEIFTLLLLLFAGLVWAQEDIEAPREQKSLVTKLTATWCPICGGSAWDLYSNLVDNTEGKAVVLAAHYSGSSKLHSSAAVDLIGAYNGTPSGQPIFYHNQDRVSSSASQIADRVNADFAESPLAQTGIVLEYDLTNQQLVARTRTQFFESTSGEYYLSVLLVEKEVTEEQSGRGGGATHKRVLREALTTETLGEMIASGSIAQDATYDLTVRKSIASFSEADKYQVATILWRKTDEERVFVNANFSSNIAEATTTDAFTLERAGVSLTVQPNPAADQAEVRIQAPFPLDGFRLDLYSAAGQRLQTWTENDFSGSALNLTLDRGVMPTAGLYFLQLATDRGIMTRKVVVR